MTLEQYIQKQFAFWRKQNISVDDIRAVTTMKQAEWLDERGNQEIFNNNLQRS